MNFKTTYYLFGGLILFAVLLALVQLLSSKPGANDLVLPSLPSAHLAAKDFTTVEINRNRPTAERIVFERDATTKRWKMTQPVATRIDGDGLVDSIISQLSEARKEEKADMSRNRQQYGLDPPAATVTLTAADGRTWKLDLGDESVAGPRAAVYAATADSSNEPFAILRRDVDSLLKTVKDYRSKDLLTASSLNITSVDLSDKDHTLKLARKDDNTWRFEKPPFGTAEVDGESLGAPPMPGAPEKITGVKDLLAALEAIKVASNPETKTNDFVADNVSDLAKYGLAEPQKAYLRLEAMVKPGNMFGGDPNAAPEKVVLLVGDEVKDSKGEKRYARLESEKNVVQVPVKLLTPIVKVIDDPNVLRNRDLLTVNTRNVDALDLKNTGLVKLRKVQDSWKLIEDGNAKGRNADLMVVNALLGEHGLSAKRLVKNFPDDAKTDKDLGLDNPVAVLSVWVDGLEKDAKDGPKLKDEKKPTMKLTFGNRLPAEKDIIYVKREVGDDKVRLAVPASVLDRLTEGKLAFLDKTLPSFSSRADIPKIVIVRGKETVELEREKKADEKGPVVWKLKQPASLAGRIADPEKVRVLVEDLARLSPEKLVAEKPDAKELKNWGLDPAQSTVTVTVRPDPKDEKKTEEWVYQFGNEDKAAGIYGKMNKSDFVYLASPGVANSFNADFADKRIYTFNPKQVKKVELVGWRPVQKVDETLIVERDRDGKDWTVKEPAKFPLEPFKIDSLIADLANLRAEKFLSLKAGPKPEHGLNPADQSLEIKIWMEGDKDDGKPSYVLTIGKLVKDDKSSGYAAMSNTLDKDVFLIPQSMFGKYVDTGRKYFGK